MKGIFRALFAMSLSAGASLAHTNDEATRDLTWPEAVTAAVAAYPYLDGSIIGKYLKRCYTKDATSPSVFNCLEGYLSGSTPGLTYSERLAVTTAKNKAAGQEKVEQARQRVIEIGGNGEVQGRTNSGDTASSGKRTANQPPATARSQTEPSQAEMDAWGAIGHALGCMLSGGYCAPSNANP